MPAVLAAVALFALRVPFVLVVIAAAVIAAVLRLLGWAARSNEEAILSTAESLIRLGLVKA